MRTSGSSHLVSGSSITSVDLMGLPISSPLSVWEKPALLDSGFIMSPPSPVSSLLPCSVLPQVGMLCESASVGLAQRVRREPIHGRGYHG